MERVGVLINKLQEQLVQKADVSHMLVTVQMLHNELMSQPSLADRKVTGKVAVVVPNGTVIAPMLHEDDPKHEAFKPVVTPIPEPEPVVEPMPEPETPLPETLPVPTIKPEPEPIPHSQDQKLWHDVFPAKEEKTVWSLDPVSEAPTLAQQEKVVYELNDTMVGESPKSINDKLKETRSEMGSVLKEAPVRDLKKAISINDRHRFIHELFRDDETMYERSVKTINGFHIFAEAEFWIQRELKVKLGWDSNLDLVNTFDQLVKRRFS